MKTTWVHNYLCFGLLASTLNYGSAVFKDCGGKDKIIKFKNISIHPDPIKYPGNVTISLALDVLKTLPGKPDLEMAINILKLEPFEMEVPCLDDNIGSCSYDFCQMIEDHKNVFSSMLPNSKNSQCPLKAASYTIKDAQMSLPYFGDALQDILETSELFFGRYEVNIKMNDKSTDKELGCVSTTFDITPGERPTDVVEDDF